VNELTTIEWINVLGAVLCAGAAVVALLRGRRWSALLVAIVAAQCLVTFIALRANAYHRYGYLISLPFAAAVLLLLGRVREEAERWKARRAGGAGERAL
jgi:hypothetical protein